MKKILALLMAGAIALTAMAGCGVSVKDKKETDWDYLKNKGKLKIGITYYEPMNYKDGDGKLVGFETEFAEAVCDEIGLDPDFHEIDWDSKELELKSKSIDCVWNGMTITNERKENMDISVPYLNNKQVMVCKKSNVEKYKASADGAKVVAEGGSAGETIAQKESFFSKAKYTSVNAQSTALLEVKAGTSDIAVIDYVMAVATLKEGSDYADLAVVEGMTFGDEQFGVALRKDSPETLEKLNDAIKKLYGNGKLKEIAEKYKLADMLVDNSK